MCEKSFPNIADYLKHRKRFHEENVPACKNEKNGTCTYGNQNCWFKHSENEDINKNEENENSKIEKDEVVQRLFQMMEKLTECIFQIEKKDKEQDMKLKMKMKWTRKMKMKWIKKLK